MGTFTLIKKIAINIWKILELMFPAKVEVSVDDTKIKNSPEGKNGKDDKTAVDDIGSKYGLDS